MSRRVSELRDRGDGKAHQLVIAGRRIHALRRIGGHTPKIPRKAGFR